MPLRYKEKIRLRKQSHFNRFKPKITTDLKDINKNIGIKKREIRKPIDLEHTLTEVKQKFSSLVAPFIVGEYKKGTKKALVYDKMDRTIKLRYQMMSLKDHISDFVFQLRMYVIAHSENKERIKELEKEIKEWGKITTRVLNDFIDKISFVIENYFVPIFNKLKKEKVSS